MIIEYRGKARQWAGTGEVHEVAAIWNALRDDQSAVKRASAKAVRDVVGKGRSVTFESWDMGTSSHPTLDALIRIRVLTKEQADRKKELTMRRYETCDKCGAKGPGQLVQMKDDGTEQALCYGCWNPLRSKCKVLHYINKFGKLQI